MREVLSRIADPTSDLEITGGIDGDRIARITAAAAKIGGVSERGVKHELAIVLSQRKAHRIRSQEPETALHRFANPFLQLIYNRLLKRDLAMLRLDP
jgi:hypothetical protein